MDLRWKDSLITRAGCVVARNVFRKAVLSAVLFPLALGLTPVAAQPGSTSDGLRVQAAPTVSLHELAHKVPSDARKEYGRAIHALQKNDSAAEIVHLRKAVAIDKEFLSAQEALGDAEVKSEDYAGAAKAFEAVARYDPHDDSIYGDLAIVYLHQDRLADAEAAARRAFSRDGASKQDCYLLGLSLARQGKMEAIRYLYASANQFPEAYLMAVLLLSQQGQVKEAQAAARLYLATGVRAYREEVGKWLAGNDVSEKAALDAPPQSLVDAGPPLHPAK